MKNHHQPPDQPTPECAAIGALLPLLDDDTLTPEEAAQVRSHLAGCSTCQAQRRAYSQLNIALRRHFGPTAFAPLRTEEIMGELPDTDPFLISIEPLEVTSLPAASRLPLPRHPRRLLSGAASLAAVLVIALFATLIFNHHPGSNTSPSNHSGSQTVTRSAFSGISMVSPDEGWMVGATSTITYASENSSQSSSSTPGQLSSSSQTVLTIDEPGKGSILLYHYKNGTWTQVHVSLHVTGVSFLTAVSMDSPTDGWAVGGWYQPQAGDPSYQLPAMQALLLHYDGTTWQQVNTSILFALGTVDMLSATNGWALTEGTGSQAPEILHYDGRAWTSQPLPASLASLAASKEALFNFTGFSALPDGEAWAGAVFFPNAPISSSGAPSSSNSGSSASSSTTPGQSIPGQPGAPSSVILHYVGGVWTIQAAFANAIVNGLALAGPEDGWATGQDLSGLGGTNGQPPQQTQAPATLVLRYSGGRWSRVTVPLPGDNGTTSVTLTHIVAITPSDIWILGMAEKTTTSMVVQGSQGSQSDTQFSAPQGSLVLLHYDGARWTSVAQPSLPANALPSIVDAAFTSPSNGWAVGTLVTFPHTVGSGSDFAAPNTMPLVLHYANGVWSRYNL